MSPSPLGGEHDGRLPGRHDLQRHLAMPDQKELVGGIALVDQILAGIEAMIARAAGNRPRPSSASSPAKNGCARTMRSSPSMVGLLGFAGVARIAAASAVMSMPTGHQVMQRPQPTQPEVPNWSIQLASLWVIHCR